jgi:hypothetical protein
MEILTLVALIAAGAYILKSRDQRQRIALLGTHLGRYQIEKLMESLTSGYLRCLGEDDPERRHQIWSLLDSTEEKLSAQFDSFAAEFARTPEADTRVSKLPVAIPFAHKLFPAATFDLRQALADSCARHRRRDEERSAALGQVQGLHHVGRTVPDAAHLPLVLQVEDRGVGPHAGAPPDLVRAAARCSEPRDARGLSRPDRFLRSRCLQVGRSRPFSDVTTTAAAA